jgi:hypothetical protein
MANGFIRRFACVAALIGLGVASAPPVDAAPATAVVVSTGSSPVAHAVTANRLVPRETGRGWGSMIACAACAVGAGVVIAGGPGAILLAVNTPGSAVALFACAASCYEAF